jgi:hypothetical protein
MHESCIVLRFACTWSKIHMLASHIVCEMASSIRCIIILRPSADFYARREARKGSHAGLHAPHPHITGVVCPINRTPEHNAIGVQAPSLAEASRALPTTESRARLLRLSQQMGPRDAEPTLHAPFHTGDLARVLAHSGPEQGGKYRISPPVPGLAQGRSPRGG